MERTTQAQLESLVDRINDIKGLKDVQYNTVGGYLLDGAYGGWKLVKVTNESGGQTDITSGYAPKKELYYQIRAFLSGLES